MKKLIPLILIILASTLILTIIFELTPVTAADNSEPIQVTIDAVDQNGVHLNGAWANGWTEHAPIVFTVANGGTTNLMVYWSGLGCSPILPVVNKDTTYRIDALTGQVTSQSTPGVNKINVVFEPIQVTVNVVDPSGVDAVDNWGVHIGNAGLNEWSGNPTHAPAAFTAANGGSFSVGTNWGGLISGAALPAVFKDTTYTCDALTGQITSQLTPGVCVVNVVYEPIQVTVNVVDPSGVDAVDEWGVHIGGASLNTWDANPTNAPTVFTAANGGNFGVNVYWGGLNSGFSSVVHKDTTYTYDAFTGQITSQLTPGVCVVNVVFEPIQVTFDTVDQHGVHLSGPIVNAGSFYLDSTPYEFAVAKGGGCGFVIDWNGIGCWLVLPIVKDTTYSIDAVTGQITTQSSIGVCKVNVVFKTDTIDNFAIIVNQGSNGLITGPSSADWGTDASYTIVPSTGYHIVSVLVDGVSKGAVASYTISNIQETHTISASFAIDTFAITITQGANGLITGPSSASYGESLTFTITPTAGYGIASITVDGNPVAVTSLTSQTVSLTNIHASHTVTATYGLLTSGNKQITLTGNGNVIIITGGNNNIDCTQATSTTIVKTGSGNNIIKFGEGENVLTTTGGGNDIITTGNGNNKINIAGNGNNQITTKSGNDQIQITGNGDNIIKAGDGNNIVTVSGTGNNQVTTGSGDDLIAVGGGNNIINAGGGNNQVTAGKGSNQITTGTGNDVVMAGNGNNIVKSGAGDDTITVGNGNNIVDGGIGYDVCIHGTGSNIITNCEIK
jgi:hypothetical protein